MSRIVEFFRWLFRRKKEEEMIKAPERPFYPPSPVVHRAPRRPKPRRAVDQDIGKFMKHGRQSKYYRGTVKGKKKVEEE